jgi:hypothetical protein
LFKDYEFGLGLVFKQGGQKSFILTAAAVADPDRVLSDWVVNSYRSR